MHIEIVTITELSEEGKGLGVLNNSDGTTRQVEVPFTLPGDVVEIELRRARRRKRGQGVITSFIEKSPLRVEPRCKHFASCGGCSFQHIAYQDQLTMKEKSVHDLFLPLKQESTVFYPILASQSAWNYRNKMEYSFSQNARGEKFLGLILSGTRGWVFNLEECHLVDSWFATTVKEVSAWWEQSAITAYFHGADRGTLRTLTLRHGITSGDRMVILTVSGNPEFAIKKQELDSFVSLIQKVATPELPAHLSIVLRVQQIAKGQPTQFYEMILSGPDYIRETVSVGSEQHEFRISPKAFFQPNTRTANNLYAKAIELADITAQSVVYDLYAGIGVFGMSLAHKAKEVVAIELAPDSAYDAKTNSQRLNLKNFTIYEGDVGKVLQEKQDELAKPDIVIVDPPRPGLDAKALLQIIALNPQTIVYVSCNPKTQVENIKVLLDAGYSLKAVQPVDQFPHTPHVENIAICIRK